MRELIALIDFLKTLISSLFELKLPIDILSALIGGIIGLLLVEIWDWRKKPKLRELGFVKIDVNFGTLYKLKFKITGKQHPGICQLEIKWNNKSVKAKWDETPNPLQNDDINKFYVELVPVTFYQPLFLNKEYLIPIIHKDGNGKLSIFSGWWFGRNKGYGPNPEVTKDNQIELILSGNNLYWRRSYKVENIIELAGKENNKYK